jgi:hypothetical protein
MARVSQQALRLRTDSSENVMVNLDQFGGASAGPEEKVILLHGQDKSPGSFAITPASMTTAATVYGLCRSGVLTGSFAVC